jgi:hypothetical protein
MHNQTNMPMQTRSMINRSKPALAVSVEVSDESPFIPSHPHASSPIANSAGDTASSAICSGCDEEASDSQATIVDEEEEKEFDPNHFCPSWVKCCEDNLALQPKHTDPRWPEKLPTYRAWFSGKGRHGIGGEVSLAWRAYISEICHAISYEGADGDALNNYEYESAHAFMHGNL